MIIKVIAADEAEKRTAWHGFALSYKAFYVVLAVRIARRRMQYLTVDGDRLWWWDADLFEVVDKSYPNEWIEMKYKLFHKFKNKKYDFDVPTTYYRGPKEFLDNENFNFDIYDNPRIAYSFYKESRLFHIFEGIERKWSLEITEKLIDEICNENNISQLVPLSRLNLPENEIIDAFMRLANTSRNKEIGQAIQQLRPLFDPNMYFKIYNLFWNPTIEINN